VAALTRNRVRRARPLAGLEGMAPRKVRWAACLATDLTDYVGLTEALAGREPDLADLVARYRAVLHETVERSGGYVLNLAGDASICLWEAAGPDRGARERAARAALELVGALDRFAAEQGLLAGHLTRAGLAAGWVVLGNFAQGGRFSFAGVGEPLNLASRLEQLNKQLGTRILAAAEAVADLDGLPLRPLGAFRLKGVAQPQEVVALDPTPAQGVQSVTAHARLR
jgi:adenylate cyclase